MTEKKMKIVLTGRRPVSVNPSVWSRIVNDVEGDSFEGNDHGRHSQALAQGECATWAMTVRQHEDGRAIVYVRATAGWRGSVAHDGGELLAPGADIAEAVERVGRACGVPEETVRECIANLPAEEL